MFDYCVQELGFSRDAAAKRIRAARAARRFPVLFDAVADGRLNLSSLVVLASHLSEETLEDLVGMAAHKTKAEIEAVLARRSSQPEISWAVEAPAVMPTPSSLPACQVAPGPLMSRVCEPKQAPVTQRFPLRLTMDQRTRDQLRYAQELLSHKIPSGDASQIIALALEALIAQLEKRKFAGTSRPRSKSNGASGRTIPAAVKREVWERDGGQCTFVSEAGRRCSSRKFLEFDHVLEFALGGRATPDGIRLRCRAHNQYTAAETFGAAFMERKREDAKRAAAEAARARARETATRAQDDEAARAREAEVTPWLRALGFNATEARRGAAACGSMDDASLEDRVRFAIGALRPPVAARFRPAPALGASG